jgi:hypothetical protein
VPACAWSSAIARRGERAVRYERSVVIAWKASQQNTMRAASGIASPAEAVRIARPVPALVTRAHDDAHATEQAADLGQHAVALDRVGLDDGELLLRQRTALVDDLVVDRDLAHVVQQGGELELDPVLALDAELVATRSARLTTPRPCSPVSRSSEATTRSSSSAEPR